MCIDLAVELTACAVAKLYGPNYPNAAALAITIRERHPSQR